MFYLIRVFLGSIFAFLYLALAVLGALGIAAFVYAVW